MDISKIIARTLVATLFNLLTVFSVGQDRAKSTPQGTQSAQPDSNETRAPGARITFSSRDRETIRVYYKNLSAKLSHGTVGRGAPPALQPTAEREALSSTYLLTRITPCPPDLHPHPPRSPPHCPRATMHAEP